MDQALLLIDLQNEVLHPKGTLSGDLPNVADRLVTNTRRLVSWARAQAVPVIWVRMAFRPGYIDASRSVRASAAEMRGRLVEGTWGAEILDDIGRRADDPVVTKKRPSAFKCTDLCFVLRGLGTRRLIVAGTSTNWAVEATVRDAESLDYEVVVVADATGARMGDLHEAALRNMATRYAVVMSTDEVVALRSHGDSR